MSQHMKTFVGKEGIAPHIEVAINNIVESRIEYLLPTLSANTPHIIDPNTVADIAIVGRIAPDVGVILYSLSNPKKKGSKKNR